MQRSRVEHTQSLEERLTEEASRFRVEDEALPPGADRDELVRRARQAETASHMNRWLTSPVLQPPK